MDNPVDHIVDMGLVNFVKHPTNKDYIVYRFADKRRAEAFESELKKQDIWYEASSEKGKQKEYLLFGIHKHDFKKSQQINYDVEAKFKKPFLPFRILRYSVLLIFVAAITLAAVGYCKAQNKLASYNKNETSVNH